MSEPIPREALIKKIKACFHDSDTIDRATFANIEQLINAEVLAVLNRVDDKLFFDSVNPEGRFIKQVITEERSNYDQPHNPGR